MLDSRVIAQVCLGIGIIVAAALGGRTLLDIKKLDQAVRVKGLAERVVKANEASWVIEFQASAPDISKLNDKVSTARKTIEEFIKEQGFEPSQIQRPPVSISQVGKHDSSREKEYMASGQVIVSSSDVDRVTKSVETTDALLQKGVLVTRSSVSYYFTDLNTIKPEMLKQASDNARQAAAKFAEDSGVKIGLIKSAEQGPFSITAPFSEWGGETGSIMKRVRVVTSVEFFLER